jgi:deazaflavin-dependent oxidoreductase (nitroreductase family)
VPEDANRWVIEEFRAHGGRVGGPFEGAPLLLLTTAGARTGRPHTTPAAYARDGDRLLVFATNAGRPRHPAWYHNLRADPHGDVSVDGATHRCRAVEAEGPERAAIWEQGLAIYPGWSQYEVRAAHRQIHVFVLEPLP